LTIDPGVVASVFNPVDDSRFFITQHYKDITGRKAPTELVERFVTQQLQCASRTDCLRSRRLDISTALMLEEELPASIFVHGLYSVALGRRPKFSEFDADRNLINSGPDTDASRHALALAFVERSEFQRKYSELTAEQFVDTLISTAKETAGVNLDSERKTLLALHDGSNVGRAKILSRLITQPSFTDAQYNQTFVLMQFFAFLRRDPDKDAYDHWVNVLKHKPLRDRAAARSVVCAFLSSAEYQSRFAMVDAHNPAVCN
jgi:hypothetical protein